LQDTGKFAVAIKGRAAFGSPFVGSQINILEVSPGHSGVDVARLRNRRVDQARSDAKNIDVLCSSNFA
jgi:hypothetical protein